MHKTTCAAPGLISLFALSLCACSTQPPRVIEIERARIVVPPAALTDPLPLPEACQQTRKTGDLVACRVALEAVRLQCNVDRAAMRNGDDGE